MELKKNEKLLIEAVRAMDEVPANVLLWYTAGLEEALKVTMAIQGKDYRGDQNKIDIANEYQRKMSQFLTSAE